MSHKLAWSAARPTENSRDVSSHSSENNEADEESNSTDRAPCKDHSLHPLCYYWSFCNPSWLGITLFADQHAINCDPRYDFSISDSWKKLHYILWLISILKKKINQETLYAFVGSERERNFVIYGSESVSIGVESLIWMLQHCMLILWATQMASRGRNSIQMRPKEAQVESPKNVIYLMNP